MKTYTCLPYLVLDPSFPRVETNYEFTPEQTVFVPVYYNAYNEQLYCNLAFKSELAARTHFWYRKGTFDEDESVKTLQMTVKQFLKQHDWSGMNPFETLNKLEFIKTYMDKYPEEMKGP